MFRIKMFIAASLCLLAVSVSAQNYTNGVLKVASLNGATIALGGRFELWVTNSITPLTGCTIDITSPDAFLILSGIKPSVAVSNYLSQVKISGLLALIDVNCRVVQYGSGAIIFAHNSTFKPLTVYYGPNFTGSSSNLLPYVYNTSLGAFANNIRSFKLKRGYAVTFAETATGGGVSKNYVAADGDLEIGQLPADLDHNVSFIYVTPWRWTSKKGIAGDPGNSLLNVQWWYNWNLDQNSSRDFEYVPIRQQRWWPGLGQDWKTRGANSVLGYNEPDKSDQANIAVGDAIWSWPDLLGTGLRVGAPAVSDGGRSSWLYPFMSQADAANLRVDFVPVHYYWCFNPADPNGAATQMYNFLKATYDTVKRPLWVTEWNNGATWTGCGDPTYAQQKSAIAAMTAMLDSTPFVERYALYNWVETVRQVTTNGVLTGAGVSYRDEYSPVGYSQNLPDNKTHGITQLRFESNLTDSSGYFNNAVGTGCPVYTNGHSGSGLLFDGANTFVTLPPNIAKGTNFTFAAWVYWKGGPSWQRIFDFGNSTTHYMFLTPNASGSNFRFVINNGNGEQVSQTLAALPSNSWQHVAVTLSGGTARLYVNGSQVKVSTGISNTPADFMPLINRLGKSQFSADPLFNGVMDDVLIADRAFAGLEILKLQSDTAPQFTAPSYAMPVSIEGNLFSTNIAALATDPDFAETLTFSMVSGPAWLNLSTNGVLSGVPTSGDGGTNFFTMRVTDAAGLSAFALLTVPVLTINANGIWTSDGDGNWSDTNRWTAKVVATGMGQTADFSTINISANRTVTLDVSRTIGNLRFSDIGSQNWTLTNLPGTALTLNSGAGISPTILVTNTVTIGATLAGTNGFTKLRRGTLILSGDNSLTGPVYLDSNSSGTNDGVVRVVAPNALATASIIAIRNNNNGTSTLQVDGSQGNITINANFTVTYRNNGVVTIQNLAGTNIFNGKFQMLEGGNSHTVQSDAGLIVFTGTNQYVGALSGVRTNYFTGAGNHLVVGPIVDSTNFAPISLVKQGTGKLTLAGPNTYGNSTLASNSTATVLSGGKLIVNGVLPLEPFVMSPGTTLGGSGIIQPAVNVPVIGTLAPGDDGIGILTVSNNVTLAPGSTTIFEVNADNNSNDVLVVSGLLSLGGTLTVSNLSGTLVGGDSFQILKAPSISGSFLVTNLPVLPPGMNWNWNPATGFLSISGIATNPAPMSVVLDGSNLQMSWPADHLGWRLQVQTNDLATGLAPNWFDVAGSTATNTMSFGLDPISGSVFYRLIYP